MLRLLVLIPAFNEQENIVRVVEELRCQVPQYDYLIVNDGSSDQTGEICRQQHYPILDLPINLGLAGAFQAGMRYALMADYDAVLQFDGDGQHCPQYIAQMEEELLKGYDIVIGSRFVEEKKPATLRMVGNRMISAAIFLTTGKRITDPTSGMRLYSRKMIHMFAQQPNFDPEPDTLCYLIKKQGVRISEVQVEMRERIAGKSYLDFSRSVSYMLRMAVSILLVQWFRKGSC